jgi:hypothetical protein
MEGIQVATTVKGMLGIQVGEEVDLDCTGASCW